MLPFCLSHINTWPQWVNQEKKQHDIGFFNAIELKLLSFYPKTLTYDKKTFCTTYKELPVTVIYQQKKGLKRKRLGRGIIGIRWFQQFRDVFPCCRLYQFFAFKLSLYQVLLHELCTSRGMNPLVYWGTCRF